MNKSMNLRDVPVDLLRRAKAAAEGIEDGSQLQRLRTFGCEYGQGYLFAKPLSREDTELLLTEWCATGTAALGDHATSA